MKKIYIFLIALLIFISYTCNTIEPVPQIQGIYNGIFSRTNFAGTDSVFIEQGVVTFEFTNRTYRCEGEEKYLPPFSIGRYSINFNFITLTDTIGHYADFDWTLILDGEFSYALDENTLTLTQDDTKHKRKYKIELTKTN